MKTLIIGIYIGRYIKEYISILAKSYIIYFYHEMALKPKA